MRRSLCSAAMLCMLLQAAAQSGIYDASTIPGQLKKNANSVKREEKIELDVKATGKAFYKVHKVVTILNEAGNEDLNFYVYADQFHSLEEAFIGVYDSKGVALHKYSRSDLLKQAVGEGLVPEGKLYYLKIPVPSYPVTIATDYTIRFNGILNYPDYDVQLPEQAVESSVFTVRVPADIDLRYKQQNYRADPVTGNDGKYKTYSWELKLLPALEYEEGSVSRESRYPRILLAPNKFELDGNAGDMSSWRQFGQWYGALAKNAMNLPEERKQFFRELVKSAPCEMDKIRIIYNYLQNNFRYVSIQLGIGGFKPFDADFVDKKKYGDCKALSNYTQACLDAIGIKSYQALVNAEYNKEPVDPGFPRNGFNHVIVCVPMPRDTVWLECTSSTTDFGVLGNFTENRNALVITEDGGKLVATPKSNAEENVFHSNAVVNVNEDGTGTAKLVIFTTGAYKQEFVHYIAEAVKDEQKNFLVNDLGFLPPDKFDIQYDKKNTQVTTISMAIDKIPDFTAGKKFFLNPRIYKIWSHALPKAENRTQDFYFQHPFIKTDTTTYKLPEGYRLEILPGGKDLHFEYGSFTSTYRYDEKLNSIITTARLVLNEYKIPAAKFAATKKFFNEVLAEYTEKIVVKGL